MTWKDIKLITLQKMFSADGNNIPNDDSTKDYIAGMPHVANEGLLMICTSKHPILKHVDLTEEEGQVIGERRVYDVGEVVDDFYQFYPEVYYTENERERACDFYTEAHSVFSVPANRKGVYTVYYYSYPEEITPSTRDDYEMKSPKDVLAILPLYMASQLYKEDDNGIATSLRNEFEVALDRVAFNNPMRKQTAYRESGW